MRVIKLTYQTENGTETIGERVALKWDMLDSHLFQRDYVCHICGIMRVEVPITRVCRPCTLRYLVRYERPDDLRCVMCLGWLCPYLEQAYYGRICVDTACHAAYVKTRAFLAAVALRPHLPREICQMVWRQVVKN
jgi:hypothetical protein